MKQSALARRCLKRQLHHRPSAPGRGVAEIPMKSSAYSGGGEYWPSNRIAIAGGWGSGAHSSRERYGTCVLAAHIRPCSRIKVTNSVVGRPRLKPVIFTDEPRRPLVAGAFVFWA